MAWHACMYVCMGFTLRSTNGAKDYSNQVVCVLLSLPLLCRSRAIDTERQINEEVGYASGVVGWFIAVDRDMSKATRISTLVQHRRGPFASSSDIRAPLRVSVCS
ncbi:hypothetical protein LZ30DRAFT_704104 [Colletotrichum cereale]|nr:hypothetical protein LZ30DRAFT_704104 [Colletotrichum cereale]